jgi:hypothetical protein
MADDRAAYATSMSALAAHAIDDDVDLDIIGAIEGADKSSSVGFAWDYLRHYEHAFRPFRHQPINLIEVGIRSGSSLRLWKWYFSAATIIGIDINPVCVALAGERVQIAIGSQADGAFLASVCAANPPAIFIDDGSHNADHNIYTFEQVFPRLLPGGVYVVEDLKFHFGANARKWQGETPRNAPAYFLDLARNCVSGRQVPGQEDVASGLTAMVDSVHFVGGAAIITKRKARRNLARAVEIGQAYLAAHGDDPAGRLRLAEYLLAHDGALTEAEAHCDAALAAEGPSLPALTAKAAILLRTGRKAEAVAVTEQAAGLDHGDRRALMPLARQQHALGLRYQTLSTIEKILAWVPDHGPALHLRRLVLAG